MRYIVNQGEAIITRDFLNTELGWQERGTNQSCTFVWQNWLYVFEDLNGHGRVHRRNQKKEMQTDNMTYSVTLDDNLLNEITEIVRILVQSNISLSLNVVMR